MNDDEIRVEAEYLQTREREIGAELKRAAEDLGLPEVTESIARVEVDGVVEALRRSGHGVLAGNYTAAFERFAARVAELEAAGHIDQEALAAMHDAEEQFERVTAEVNACLDESVRALSAGVGTTSTQEILSMRTDYVSKKLFEAVYTLAGAGTIQERLAGAYGHLHVLTVADFAPLDEYLRDGFVALQRRAASASRLNDDEASTLAHQIVEMYEHIMQG